MAQREDLFLAARAPSSERATTAANAALPHRVVVGPCPGQSAHVRPANDARVPVERSKHPAKLERPSDWPKAGPIDLALHDPPHASSALEWWYVNTHLKLDSGQTVGVFAAFFRKLAPPKDDAQTPIHTHSVAWGVSLHTDQMLLSKVAVDELAPQVGLQSLETRLKGDDARVERALREVLAKGRVPGPTTMFSRPAVVDLDQLRLDFDGDCLHVDPVSHEYHLQLQDSKKGVSCRLTLALQKQPIAYGNDGVVSGVGGELMFYYFVPRALVTGEVTLGGRTHAVVRGQGWYDHEFGVLPREALDPEQRGQLANHGETTWRWLSIQLDTGSELSVYFISRRATGEVLDRWAILSSADGRSEALTDVRLVNLEYWRSTRTFIAYPVRLVVELPSRGIRLIASASFPDQEVVTVISDPAFWEGTVHVEGRVGDEEVTGRGWLECKGFGHASLDDFYGAVGREVRERLAQELPFTPTGKQLSHLLARGQAQRGEDTFGADGARLGACLTAPIRTIADRGGKSWRSYAALACIDAVGGDSRKFLHWLVQPEIVHVGSLIVDDVEDASAIRRAGPTCHRLYGTPTAINAGTAAYFLAEPPVDGDPLTDAQKLRIYRYYFDAMRAGHAGQALDLQDISDLAISAVETGNTDELERHVIVVHRLKTGAPAAMFARTGALLGGGSDEQIERVGAFFEAVGLAFQVIDDVLNVSGFEGNLKERGEDIRAGKVTLPVVKALSSLSRRERRWLWQTLSAQPQEDAVVCQVASVLEQSGAIAACRTLSEQVVERAWRDLDPVLVDSQFKLMLRAFSWYVLERHY